MKSTIKTHKEPMVGSEDTRKQSDNPESVNGISSHQNSDKRGDKKCYRTFLDDIASSLADSLLGEILCLIPLGIIAWVFITWGVIWLLVPLVAVSILIFMWLRR